MTSKKETAQNSPSKLLLIVEVMVVTFLICIIPDLIAIGRIPTLDEVYVPILSAILMAIYAYIKIRDIDIETE